MYRPHMSSIHSFMNSMRIFYSAPKRLRINVWSYYSWRLTWKLLISAEYFMFPPFHYVSGHYWKIKLFRRRLLNPKMVIFFFCFALEQDLFAPGRSSYHLINLIRASVVFVYYFRHTFIVHAHKMLAWKHSNALMDGSLICFLLVGPSFFPEHTHNVVEHEATLSELISHGSASLNQCPFCRTSLGMSSTLVWYK